jgi:long-chain acyl-CoA synthetase
MSFSEYTVLVRFWFSSHNIHIPREGDGRVTNSLMEMLEQSVQQYAERPALWDPLPGGGYEEISYYAFWKRIQNVACRLNQLEVHAGDKVGLLALSRSWWPIVDVAVMSLGAATVPIYPSLPPNQMAFIIRHSRMVGLFVQDMKQLNKLLQIPREAIPDLRFVGILDDSRDEALLSEAGKRFQLCYYSDWMTDGAPVWGENEWKGHWAAVDRSTMATIVFTSGTTGTPKGVVLTHGNLLANLEGIKEVVPLSPTDRSLSYLPLSHIFERTCGQFVPLAAGASIAYARDFNRIIEDFQEMPPTLLTTVPRLLEKIQEGILEKVRQQGTLTQKLFDWAVGVGTRARVERRQSPGIRLRIADRLVFSKIHHLFGGRLRAVIVGGAPLPRHVGAFFTAAGLSVAEGYGMTETSPVVSANRPESPVLGTAGVILSNVQVRIAEDGEVLVKGPSVMKGYFENDEATREAFTEDGWLRTGDIGRITSTGELQITDRKKNLIVLSTGKKVTPAPIEGDILRRPAIDQVVLIGQGRKYVSAIVVPNEDVVREWFREQNRAIPPRQFWSREPWLVERLLREVQDATRDYARFEQPKKVIVADEPFTIDNGLLTPTLKARSKAVEERYQSAIEAMYAADEATSASNPA